MQEILYVPMCRNNKTQLELIETLKADGWNDKGLIELNDRLTLGYREFTCLTREKFKDGD